MVVKIILTFESGSSENLYNNIPISLLSVFSKIIEKMMHENKIK